jgi:antirestriction protein ArdC
MGAGYLNNHIGIIKDKLLDNSVAYLQYWIQILKNDKSILLEAASQAQKSVDYILMECPF